MSKRWLIIFVVVFSAVLTVHGQAQSILVDKELYSGQLDPQVIITNPATIQLLEDYYLFNLPPANKPIWPVSGPRGFRLDNNGVASFPSSEVRVFHGVIREFVAYNQYEYYQDTKGLESYLSSLFPPSSHDSVGRTPESQISEDQISDTWLGELAALLPTNGYEPPFNGALWNTGNANQHLNNCYNYSANKKTGTFAQPGRAGGRLRMGPPYTCSDVLASAIADGLIPWVANVACSNYDYKVALVIAPPNAPAPCTPADADFHWLRQNRDGFWSQKHGGDEAINVDDDPVNPMRISDPRTANRGCYTIFCGFMCVLADPNLVNIR